MNRITTFQIPVAAERLGPSLFEGAAPLVEPMQALVTAASRRAAAAPFTVYLCADDDTTRARDDFAVALARTLTPTIPSTLVIDCDFLHPGLNGQVPQRDALGFLDYLLYGSSIGMIQQESNGVHVVGPGSFPVTKRMPFVETAFSDAARRLAAHARCVIFVGPAFDGDGGRHPLMGLVDVVATVRSAARHPRLDSTEEHAGGAGVEVWSVRLGETAPAQPAAPLPPVSAPPRRPAEPAAAPAPRAPGPTVVAVPPPRDGDEAASSLAPRIIVIVIGLMVIAFVAWWFVQNRGTQPLTGSEDTNETTVAHVDTTRTAPATATPDTLAASTTPVQTAGGDTATVSAPPRQPVEKAPAPEPVPTRTTPRASGGTQLVSSEDIQLMEDLDRRFHGWFIIHISSFQSSARAREEVAFLESREFPAFIVFLDLGPKGKWYRVYAGPLETREEAREVKKNLDAIPQVRFTRIASIPD